MTDYEEVYSLLFTGVIILLLFLTVYNILTGFSESQTRLLTVNLLVSRALLFSGVVEELNLSVGSAGLTSALPVLVAKDVLIPGVAVVGE